jgi:hypothetical protein
MYAVSRDSLLDDFVIKSVEVVPQVFLDFWTFIIWYSEKNTAFWKQSVSILR